MFKKILAYFDHQQWRYNVIDEQKTIVFLGMNTENGNFHCMLDVNEHDKKFIFLSIYPKQVPKKMRRTIAELLMRINYNIFIGSFEMDFEDGEVNFKTSLIYEDCDITEKVIEHLLVSNIAAMNDNFALINAVLTKQMPLSKIKEVQLIGDNTALTI
jgi:hypothetical protein